MAATSDPVALRCARSAAHAAVRRGRSREGIHEDSLGFRVAVVLPAGGSGTRAGLPTPKQFWTVYERPILYYTLECIEAIEWIEEIIVPVAEDRLEWLEQQKRDVWRLTKTRFVVGGEARHQSIYEGVKALAAAASPPDIVIVHDAVRPFVDEKTMAEVAKAAHAHGAAGTILPLVSTVIAVDADGFLDHSLDRTKYRASQTPQAFTLAALHGAYAKCTPHDFEFGTECLHLVQIYSGVRAKLIEGNPNLWKITYRPDLYAAEQMLKERQRQVAIVTGGSRGIGEHVVRGLRNRGVQVAVVARTRADVEAVATATGSLAIVADVSVAADVQRMFDETIDYFGRVDIVVNNAGQAIVSSIADTTDEQWQAIINGNLSSTFYSCRAALRCMQECGRGGIIVNVGSSSVAGGREGQCAYASSKAGTQTLTEVVALEGKPYGVYAYCVVPRRTDTDLRRQMFPEEDPGASLRPEHVAAVIVSVVMDSNPMLTGQSFWVR
eukprot:m.48200 g.48200  ORF g.48200 m.48200 type:complete len:495 (+) comp11350_c0_seq1:22-1506(+)